MVLSTKLATALIPFFKIFEKLALVSLQLIFYFEALCRKPHYFFLLFRKSPRRFTVAVLKKGIFLSFGIETFV